MGREVTYDFDFELHLFKQLHQGVQMKWILPC